MLVKGKYSLKTTVKFITYLNGVSKCEYVDYI